MTNFVPKSGRLISNDSFIPKSGRLIAEQPVEPQKKTIGGFLGNVVKSGVENVKQVGSAILSPVQTAKNIGKLALGTAQLAIPGEQGQEDVARGVGQFYKERYGGLKNIGETFYNDPIGMALDISTLAGGVGAAAKAGKLSKVANVAGKVEKVTQPLNIVSKVASKITTPITSRIASSTPVKSVQNLFRDRATLSLNRSTPEKFTKASTKGIDINELTRKYFTPGADYDDILGSIKSRGKEGSLYKTMGKAESVIQKQVKRGGLVDVKPFIAELEKNKILLSKVTGNESRIKNLDKFIKETSEKYPEGIPVQDALQIKRIVDSQFGAKQGKKGTIVSSGQEQLANFTRTELKKMFPKAKEALRTQEEIFNLRPILEKARGITQTQGSTIRKGVFGNLDLTKPTTLLTAPIDLALSNAKTASYVAAGKLPKLPKSSKLIKAKNIFKKGVDFGKYARLFRGQEE